MAAKLRFVFLMAFLLWSGSCKAEEAGTSRQEFDTRTINTEYETIRLSRVAGPLENPWSVGFLPDGRMLVTERPGRLNIVQNGNITRISGLPEISAVRQGGLLDVLPHHNYAETGWIYLTYSKANEGGQTATALMRGRINEDNEFVDVEELFEQNKYSSPGRHYGSRLAWLADGTLLMTIGDRGVEPMRAQDRMDHAGTLLRLNDDGSVPQGNPFVGDGEALDEIYAYGLRNAQGLVVDQDTGDVWVVDHGPRGGDELNRITAGQNYGWPIVTRGRDYATQGPLPQAEARQMEGIVEPVYDFLITHAPSGLALVTAEQFPAWRGNLLSGGLMAQRIRRLVLDDYEVVHDEELLLREIGRIRDVREGPDGRIYILTDHNEGGLYVIERAGGRWRAWED